MMDTDKTGVVIFPDGSSIATVEGVIDTVWGGDPGSISYYFPKNTATVDISNSDVTGNLVSTANVYCGAELCLLIDSLISNMATSVIVQDSTNMVSLSSTSAYLEVNASNCTSLETITISQNCNALYLANCAALTIANQKYIIDTLYTGAIAGNIGGTLDMTGVIASSWPVDISAIHGISYADMMSNLTSIYLWTVTV